MVGTRDPKPQICVNDINWNTYIYIYIYIGDIEILSGMPGPSKGNYKTVLILLPM